MSEMFSLLPGTAFVFCRMPLTPQIVARTDSQASMVRQTSFHTARGSKKSPASVPYSYVDERFRQTRVQFFVRATPVRGSGVMISFRCFVILILERGVGKSV